jgi:outer membrane cobalamin receptor
VNKWISMATVMLVPILAWAQVPYPFVVDDSARVVYVLDEVVVYFPKPSANPYSVTEVTASRIKSQSAHSMAEVIKYDPGLTVTSGTKNSSELRIRGSKKESVLFLLDGRPLNAGYFGSWDLSLLPVDQIEKIQIVKGPASVVYGANAMGGIVNIITKNGAGLPLRGSVQGLFGDLDHRELSASIGGSAGDYSGWFAVEESSRSGLRMSENFQPTSLEDGAVRNNSDRHSLGAHLKLRRELGNVGNISAVLSYVRADKGLPGSTHEARYWRFVDWLRTGGNVSALYRITSTFSLQGSIFANQYDDELVNYLDNTYSMDRIDYDSRMVNWTYGTDFQAQWTGIRTHLITAGFRGQEDRSKKRDLDKDFPWERHSSRMGSVFLEDRWQVAKDVLITGGLGVYGLYKVDANSSDGAVCPMISVTNELPLSITTHVGASRSVFFPTLHNLFSPSSGNRNLEPEVAWKYEISVEQIILLGAHRFLNPELAIFYNDITNQIDQSPWTGIYRNIYAINTWGIDASMGWGISRWLSGSFGFGWLNWKTAEPIILETPHYKISGILQGKLPWKTQVNLDLAWFGRRKAEAMSNYYLFLRDYIVCHGNITQPLTPWLDARIEARNIFDANYEEEYGYPCEGRTILAGVNVKFQRNAE